MIINDLRMPTHLYDAACKRASSLNMGVEKYLRSLIANDLANVSTLDKEINNVKTSRTTNQ